MPNDDYIMLNYPFPIRQFLTFLLLLFIFRLKYKVLNDETSAYNVTSLFNLVILCKSNYGPADGTR